MSPKRVKGVVSYTDARGRRRWRYRAKNIDVPLGTEYGSEEFWSRLRAAQEPPDRKRRDGTLKALIQAYYDSADFRALNATTQTTYRGWMERLAEGRGDKLVRDLRRRDVLAIMAKLADTPSAANNTLRALRMLMRTALDLEWRQDDPTLGVRKYRTGAGFHTWTEAEIVQFYDHHAPGSIEHTAMTLMLYTGAARSDAVRLGWQNVREGRIEYRRQKMRSRGGVLIAVPIHPALSAVLDALPRDAMTFLQTQTGTSRSPNAFGNLMRAACRSAGLPHCSTHGLRKAMARRLAEAGATPSQIAAVTGHQSLKEVERYSADANRADLASAAIHKLKTV